MVQVKIASTPLFRRDPCCLSTYLQGSHFRYVCKISEEHAKTLVVSLPDTPPPLVFRLLPANARPEIHSFSLRCQQTDGCGSG